MKTNAIKLEFSFGVGKAHNQDTISRKVICCGLAQIKATAVKFWGGYTLTLGVGGWVNPTGALVEEPAYLLTVCTNAARESDIEDTLETIKKALNQEAVAITITGVNFQIL